MAVMRKDLEDWMQLVRRESHVLRERPSLLFQLAANQPDDSAPARIARSRLDAGREKRPWLRLINKPRRGSGLRVTLLGHSDQVLCCAVSPDGSRVVSGSSDETLRLWDAESGAELSILAGHTGQVVKCAFSRDGARLASASGALLASRSHDLTIRIWDATSFETTSILRVDGHPSHAVPVALSFLPDGRLISAHGDESLRIWDPVTGALIRVIAAKDPEEKGIADLEVSPSGSRIVTLHGGALAGGTVKRNVKVWDGETFELVAHFQNDSGARPAACAFSPDEARFVTVGQGVLKTWDTSTWSELSSVTDSGVSHAEACAFDGDRVVTVSDMRNVVVFDASTGDKLASYTAHSNTITCCELTPDGSQLVTGSHDRTLRIWTLAAVGNAARTHDEQINCVVFSPDGKQVMSASADSTVKISDAFTGDLIKVLKVEGKRRGASYLRRAGVVFCGYSPDGTRVVTWGDCDPALRIIHLESGEEVASMSSEWAGSRGFFTPDGSAVISTGGHIELWNQETGVVTNVFQPGINDPLRWWQLLSSDCSAGGRFIAAAFYQRGVHVFDMQSGTVLSGDGWDHPDIEFCAIAADETTLLYAGPSIGVMTVTLNSPGEPTRRAIFEEGGRLKFCRFSPEGTRLLTVRKAESAEWEEGVLQSPARPEEIKLWSLPQYALDREIPESSGILSCLFSPTGSYIVLLEESRVRILSVLDPGESAELRSHLKLGSVAVSADGTRVAIGAKSGDLLLLRLENFGSAAS